MSLPPISKQLLPLTTIGEAANNYLNNDSKINVIGIVVCNDLGFAAAIEWIIIL
jgi:hypothetical protein